MPTSANQIAFIQQVHNFVRTQVQNGFQNMAKGIPGHVSKILENDFIEFTIDATGPWTLPKIQIPQAFSQYHREPTKVGDKGVAVPTDYNLGGESGNDGSTANMYPRGNLTPLTFHPISNKNWPKRDPNMFLVTGGSSGHTTQSADGKTSMIIDAVNNLLHTSSADLIHQAAQQIAHIAQKTLTIASMGDVINHVASKITMGAPASTTTFSSTDEPTIPQPIQQTLLNVIGSITASANITASGAMGAAGGFVGAAGGSNAVAGGVGEVISSVNTTPVSLTSAIQANITSIVLTPGDWDIQGEVWYAPSASLSAVASGINNVSATLPGTPAISGSRIQITATLGNATITPLSPCRANITANTTYYLIAYAGITSGTCTATGRIWARRAR